MFIACKNIEVIMDGISQGKPCAPNNNCYGGDVYANEIKILFTYETITTPKTDVEVAYTVKESGSIKVDVHYFGREGLPELPTFGMRFIMPTMAERYVYDGLSGETYPDRKKGASEGIFVVDDLSLAPYLVPQECSDENR